MEERGRRLQYPAMRQPGEGLAPRRSPRLAARPGAARAREEGDEEEPEAQRPRVAQ
jgi:hypothetical protein